MRKCIFLYTNCKAQKISSLCHCRKNFDAWTNHFSWPEDDRLPLFDTISTIVEDIKFAYNAWSLIRLCLFYGTGYPSVMSNMEKVQPSMPPHKGCNHIFYNHTSINTSLNSEKFSIALTPCGANAVALQNINFSEIFTSIASGKRKGLQLVLGMENGLSESIANQCDYSAYIPQYGSIGSLSMLCALAIALNIMAIEWNRFHNHSTSNRLLFPIHGHMPMSKNTFSGALPHEANLLEMSNFRISEILKERRNQYLLQLSVIIHNEIADRNIGAVIRNANVFNCESVIVVKRKKFNRRGALGTQKIVDIIFSEALESFNCQKALEGYDIWLIYPYYPYLHLFPPFGEDISVHEAFISPDNVSFKKWKSGNALIGKSPLFQCFPHLRGNEVFLDDTDSLTEAVKEVHHRRRKGIMIALAEEGCTPHPTIVAVSSKVVFLRNPSKIPLELQRGLNGSLSSAVVLERIRTAIDSLQ